jgi:mRNA interferase HigB
MRVISRKPLREFAAKYRDADEPLATWFKLMQGCRARNLNELKCTFGSVDYVPAMKGKFHVFDICGNKYRLITVVQFDPQRVYVRHVMTHSEYARGAWK